VTPSSQPTGEPSSVPTCDMHCCVELGVQGDEVVVDEGSAGWWMILWALIILLLLLLALLAYLFHAFVLGAAAAAPVGAYAAPPFPVVFMKT
jgi:hypothetical protein